MSTLKYYIGHIEHTFGERELTYTFKFRTSKSPNELASQIAKKFWGKCRKFQDFDDTYITSDDEVTFGLGNVQEISQAAFNELHIVTTLGAS